MKHPYRMIRQALMNQACELSEAEIKLGVPSDLNLKNYYR